MQNILRKNRVELIRTLREQEYICDHLLKYDVLTEENKERVLCERTNGSRNSVLLDFVQRRRAFPHFCDALAATKQYDLLQRLAPEKIVEKNGETCVVCVHLPSRIAFDPCGHVCTCPDCATSMTHCPLCREAIAQRLRVYF